MKKAFITILTCLTVIIALMSAACGDGGKGTYYPTDAEMKTNLEKGGYSVEVYDDINRYEFFESFSSLVDGTLVKATKGDDYIYFFRLVDSWRCDTVYDILDRECENYNSLVKIENDAEFGNIVYCGTENAVNAAGIRVVKIKV